jgi:hypothetical protein
MLLQPIQQLSRHHIIDANTCRVSQLPSLCLNIAIVPSTSAPLLYTAHVATQVHSPINVIPGNQLVLSKQAKIDLKNFVIAFGQTRIDR